MTLTMRSNDVILGFMTDWAFFSVLHYHVFLHLKNYYEDLELGSYTHISHSMHLYERHYELVENMISEEFIPDQLPLINTPIINENGSFRAKYSQLFDAVLGGEFKPFKTDNDLLNYCVQKLSK
jgi:thymidylate synthase